MSGIRQEILHLKGRLSFHQEQVRRFENQAGLDAYDLVELEEHHQHISEIGETMEVLLKLEKEQYYAANKANDHSL